MRAPSRTADAVIAQIASRQHGVVERAQLVAAGISRAEISARIKRGSLIRVHLGVYRVGHRAPSIEAEYMAAVLACGAGAALTGAAGAYLFEVLKGSPPTPEVIAPTQRKVRGVITHRARRGTIAATRHKQIRVLTVPELLVALARTLSLGALARACHEAGVKYRTTPKQIVAVLTRRPNAPGAANLRRIAEGKELVTLSALERRFLKLLRENGLPLPITNRPAGGRRVDCRWPQHRLTVELDSYTFHNSRYAWEQDRRREREARARGDEFRRYTYADVFESPDLMLAELFALFSRQVS